MTIAVAFFALVGIIIVGGIGYGVGHVDGMREGYRQGQAARLDDELDRLRDTAARLRATMEHRNHSPLPFDWAQIEREMERHDAGESRWHGRG